MALFRSLTCWGQRTRRISWAVARSDRKSEGFERGLRRLEDDETLDIVRECFDRGRGLESGGMVDDAVDGLTGVNGVNGSGLGFVELELGLAGVLSCAWLFMVDATLAVASSRSGVIHPHALGSRRCDGIMLALIVLCPYLLQQDTALNSLSANLCGRQVGRRGYRFVHKLCKPSSGRRSSR